MTKLNQATPTTAAVLSLPFFSQRYTVRSNCNRARARYASQLNLSPDEFDVVKIDGAWCFKKTAESNARQESPPKGQAVVIVAPITTDKLPEGLPSALRISKEERAASWKDFKPKPAPVTVASIMEEEMRKTISAVKPVSKKATAKGNGATRTRYDWAAAEVTAKAGKLPSPPDMSAPTHRYYVHKLNEVVKLAKAGDLKGLGAYKVGPAETSSPTMVKRFLKIAIAALKAKA